MRPEIGFKGFTDDWEQRKLGELTIYRNGIGHEEKQSESGKYELVNLNSISIDGGLKSSGKFINEEVETLLKDDLVMVLSDVGHGDLLGRVAIIPENDRFVLNQRVALLRNNSSVDSNYLFYYINAHQIYFKKQGAGSSQLNISRGSVENFEVLLPHNDEQKKIGMYLSNIDHLITLHQRKYERLVNVKRSMLVKMFPQNGSKVPEIRFKGFTDDWEQRKLGELGTVQTCKRIFKEQTSEQGDIPFFKNGTIGLEPDSYISREVYEEFRRLYPYPEVGDTLISVVGSIGRTAEYTGKDEYFQDSNVVWLKTDGSINKKFLKTSYQVIKWLIEGSTVKHLYNDNILRSEIVMPVSQIEQAKIAEFFEALDNLITLHQRKIKKLQDAKKAFLTKMFA